MIDRDSVLSLELGVLVERLEELTSTPLGAERIHATAPLPTLAHALAEAAKVAEYAALLATGRDVSLGGGGDVRPVLAALHTGGLALTGEEIALARKLVAAVSEVVRFVSGSESAPSLRALLRELPGLPALAAELARSVDDEGHVLDTASPALLALRARRRVVGERVDRAVERFFESRPEIAERIATVRDDRAVVAIRSDQNPSRFGLVHGRSSTGATFYVEPFELVEPNNAVIELREAELHEVARILRALSERLAHHLPELESAADLVGELDSIRARARLRMRLGPGRVEGSLDGSFEIEEARHPLLALDARIPEDVVPLDISLRAGETVVITGPNTGGKTVALKTIGLQALLFACGLPVSARRARLPLLGSLFVDIGDPQDISQSLSTFSGHIRKVGTMLARLELPALVLLDEVGSGTDPREGAALAIAIVERVRKAGATAVVTSHHEPLKRYALATEGVRSAAVEFDLATLRPTYRLLLDRTGSSNALVIAERLGVPRDVIEHARRLLDSETTEVERLLTRLEESGRANDETRRELERERLALDLERRRLDAVDSEVARREEVLRGKQSMVRAKLRAEFEARLRQAIDELRQEGRKALESLEEGTRRRLEEKLAGGLNTVGARLLRQEEGAGLDPAEGGEAAEAPVRGTPRPGDRVRVRPLGVVGDLVALEGAVAVVSAHGKTLRTEASGLERLGRSEPGAARAGGGRAAAPRPQGGVTITLEPKAAPGGATGSDAASATELNLIGTTVDDALPQVERFVDGAVLASLPEVRIIHGHGSGRLRAGIREHLRMHPHVKALESASGGGVTVVVLEG